LDLQLQYKFLLSILLLTLTASYPIEKSRWEEVKDSKGNIPSPRYGHCCAVNADGSSMFLFGGYNKVASFNDIFEFEFGSLFLPFPLFKR